MHDPTTDPRVTARPNGGWDVATNKGSTYHVLDTGLLGWGIFHGPNLDMALTTDDRLAIGAADADQLIKALLDGDDTTNTAESTAAEAQAADQPADEDGWEA